MSKKKQERQEEEIVYEEDQGATLVKKLRAQLKECEKERKEYLDGWQRIKADMVNAQRLHATSATVSQHRAVQKVIEELLPALDSFDIAMQGDAWGNVDAQWRQGIEYVHAQLLASLKNIGVETYGAVGEVFDPSLHEAIAHTDGGPSGTVAKVERRGYKNAETILRAAHVVVYN